MPIVVLVAIGSALGGAARWALASAIDRRWEAAAVPWYGTLVVNLLGCLAIGLIAATTERTGTRALLMTGVLGGFTTFSSFSYQAVTLAQAHRLADAAALVALSLVGCLLGTVAGLALGARLAG